ncbi:MAG: class 1 fructose-bisphosphatase [Rhodothermaceae bacterium]
MQHLSKFKTIDRFILEKERQYPEATGELSAILTNLAVAAKIVSNEVNKAGLVDILGYTGDVNVQGEQVKKLDIYANDIFTKSMDYFGLIAALASEEEDDLIRMPKGDEAGKYIVLFDPLDGSSNIDVNVSIGTIFSIYKKKTPNGKAGDLQDCLQSGSEQVAAGYILYGSSTIFVYTTGEGVHGFTLDPSVGEFLLSHENIRIPENGRIYSLNEGNYKYWHQGLKNFIKYLQDATDRDEDQYTARYIGSMVADIHRNLIYGGIFIYPRDKKRPEGKLRLIYECNPMAFIVEAAGGKASNGRKRILDLEPSYLHERTPVYIGSKELVDLAEKFIIEADCGD